MSKIALAPDASGTGIFTIASPNSNTNRTLTLPDDTGTIVTNSGNQAGSFTTLNTSGQVVFNDAGADVDFRVEGDTDANLLFVDAGNDRITYGAATISSYQWTAWNPSDLVFTPTNAPATGTSDDSRYITQSNASGTLTITFDVAGKYLVCITQQTLHSQTYSAERLIANLGGTATRRINRNPANSGVDSGDWNFSISTSFYVSATASQTLTILPTYEVTGNGTIGNHVAECGVTTQYCGG